jgi:hypothetical protein
VNETISIYAPYILFLVVFLALPLLAQWRWGLLASLTVTVAELGLLLVIAYNADLIADHVDQQPLPPPRTPMPVRDRDPFTGGRPGEYAEGFARGLAVLFLVIIPGIATLVGGALSLVWAAVRASRRSEANRQRKSL